MARKNRRNQGREGITSAVTRHQTSRAAETSATVAQSPSCTHHAPILRLPGSAGRPPKPVRCRPTGFGRAARGAFLSHDRPQASIQACCTRTVGGVAMRQRLARAARERRVRAAAALRARAGSAAAPPGPTLRRRRRERDGRAIVQPGERGRARAWLGKIVGTNGSLQASRDAERRAPPKPARPSPPPPPVHSSCPDLVPAGERRAPT